MLNMGFVDDVNFIMSCMIQEHQTLLFAATMSREIDRLAAKYLKDPVRIELNKEQIAPQSLAHHFRHVGRGERLTILEEYIKEEEIAQAIIFCNSRTGGEKLLNQLRDKFDSIDFIHGGLEQARRTMIYNRFKRKEIKLMVATDIASRGLDFSHVSHVINYDFPLYHETYTHRTGRTARMGRSGIALTLVMDRDLRKLGMMLRKNRIEAVWQGHQPEVSLSPRRGRSSGARSFRHRGGGGKVRGKPAPSR
jgi:ATP-dependent RNA helicase DeaD